MRLPSSIPPLLFIGGLVVLLCTAGCMSTGNNPNSLVQGSIKGIEGSIYNARDLLPSTTELGEEYHAISSVEKPGVVFNWSGWNQSLKEEFVDSLTEEYLQSQDYLNHGLIDSSWVIWNRTRAGAQYSENGYAKVYVFSNVTGARGIFGVLSHEGLSHEKCEENPPGCYNSIQGIGDVALVRNTKNLTTEYLVCVNNAVIICVADSNPAAFTFLEKIMDKTGKTQTGSVSPTIPLTNSPRSSAGIHGSADPDTGSPVTITQTDGTNITLSCMPERIIVTNSDAAEMLIAIGAGDRIVGVTDSTKNISYIMKKIPQAKSIGNWQVPNIERILALHPDIIISYSSSRPKNLDQILASNITVVYLDCYRISSIPPDVRSLGVLTGRSGPAETYARTVENFTHIVQKRTGRLPEMERPLVYFESYSDYTAASRGSGGDEMITMAGGKNIAGDTQYSSIQISPEWVLSRQPDVIIKVISSGETRSYQDIVSGLKTRNGWEVIPAVRNNRVYAFSGNVQYGPRAYIGLAYMAKILHPDLFTDINPEDMLNEYASRYVGGTSTTAPVYPTVLPSRRD